MTYSVFQRKDNDPLPAEDETLTTAERRRIGLIVRDERDQARVEWVDAPPGQERVKLSIEGQTPQGPRGRAERGYNPYESTHRGPAPPAPPKPRKRDLRKLSEWIKQMRELEERKRREEE